MFWETLGSALVGLTLAWAATRRMPSRLPHPRIVLPTGAAGGLVGGLVAYAVMGPDHVAAALAVATGVAVAMLSLLHERSGRGAPPPVAPRPRTVVRPH